MAEATERIRGDEKDELIEQAMNTPQYTAFRSFFADEYRYELGRDTAGVIAIDQDGDRYHIVTFRQEDDNADDADRSVRVEINITLHQGHTVSSKGTIESFDDDLIEDVDVFEYVDGDVEHVGTV